MTDIKQEDSEVSMEMLFNKYEEVSEKFEIETTIELAKKIRRDSKKKKTKEMH